MTSPTSCSSAQSRRSARVLLLLAAVVALAGCPALSGGALADIADLQGEWIRFDSNNPDSIGMIIEVVDDEATVFDPADTSVSAGDIKWRGITPVGPTTFEHEELGSSGNYFPATIELLDDGTLEVLVEAAGAGNEQSWERNTADAGS
jgi:hypothetical protein